MAPEGVGSGVPRPGVRWGDRGREGGTQFFVTEA